MRLHGTGTIDVRKSGCYPRLPGQNGVRLSRCATYEEAARVLDAALAALRSGAVVDPNALTVASFGARVLDSRELAGIRGIRTERSRWRAHVAGTALAAMRLDEVRPADVRAWLASVLAKRAGKGFGHAEAPTRKLARSTVANTLQLVRIVLRVAVEQGKLSTSPATEVRLPRSQGRTHDPWTFLTPDEQAALLSVVPTRDWPLVAFALGTGLRRGEQWNLELADVDLRAGIVTVRFGSKGKATKSGKVRRVPMLPLARAALEAWLPVRGPNDDGLVFPTVRGSRRSGRPRAWTSWLALAGLDAGRHDGRHVRWHDLRHTCASSLVAGWWGRRWTLEEVRALLGHSSVTVTERYAHLAGSVIEEAARATPGGEIGSPRRVPNRSQLLAPPAEIESATFGLGRRTDPSLPRDLESLRGELVARAADGLRALATDRTPGMWRRVEEALVGVLDLARAIPCADGRRIRGGRGARGAAVASLRS